MAVPAPPILAPMRAVARTAVLVPALPAVVLAVARGAVLASALLAASPTTPTRDSRSIAGQRDPSRRRT
jgi:hypothetical protein